MLFGRRAERARINKLLDGARMRRSGVLLIRGEPGVGKTALLHSTLFRAKGMRVVSTRGIESESHLPFAGVGDLVRPILEHRRSLPVPQRSALEGALALAEPTPADRFAAYAATLALLGAAAEDQPLVVAVDDAHWLDSSSAEALVFAARRLGAEGIAMVFVVRTGLGERFEAAGFPELRVEGLDRGTARALVEARAQSPVSPEVAEALIAATRGNPLALEELVATLTPDQLGGREALPDPLPTGARLERIFLRRLEPLPPSTRRAMLVAAAADLPQTGVLARALAAEGTDLSALEPAEKEGLVTIEGPRLTFSHPLVRSAVYHGASPAERRAAHRVLGKALSDPEHAGRRAHHLSQAAVDPDESIARMLEESAAEARRRGAPGDAGEAYVRSAELSPEWEDRARRLLRAGESFRLAGQPDRGSAVLDEALSLARDPLLRADIQAVWGSIEMWRGDRLAPARARDILLEASVTIEQIDRAPAVTMLMDVVQASAMAGDVRHAVRHAERAVALAEPLGGLAVARSRMALAVSLILAGERKRGREFLVDVAARPPPSEDPFLAATGLAAIANSLVFIEEFEKAQLLTEGAISMARTSGSPASLPYPLAVLSDVLFRTGVWTQAYAAASESVELAAETGQRSEQGYSLVCLARIEAARGLEHDCRAHGEEAFRLAAAMGIGSVQTYAEAALGLLALGTGSLDEAVRHLEAVAALVEEYGVREPTVVQGAPDLIEAYVRAGRDENARRVLEDLEGQAQATGGLWARAVSARGRGMLAGDTDFERWFAAALRHHGPAPTPFERARTELALGRRRRRAQRPSDARGPLRAALATFDRLGAAPWAEQARGELRAAGVSVADVGKAPTEGIAAKLTAQELQVAMAVSRGATNKEAAAELFLSPKTIEYHLRNVYQKLGLRSRTELAALLAAPAGQG